MRHQQQRSRLLFAKKQENSKQQSGLLGLCDIEERELYQIKGKCVKRRSISRQKMQSQSCLPSRLLDNIKSAKEKERGRDNLASHIHLLHLITRGDDVHKNRLSKEKGEISEKDMWYVSPILSNLYWR